MKRFQLPRVAGRIFGEPLAIDPKKLEVIVNAVGPRLQGQAFDDDEDYPESNSAYRVASSIAVIPICGTLVARASGMTAMSGLTSYESIRANVASALADSTVSGIVFAIDSPGGEVNGMFETADAIYNARGQKPMCSVISCACSAAYAIASATDQLVILKTGMAGSIGVICLHIDESQADEKAGIKYTAIYAGDRKNDGNPHEPLSSEARRSMQSRVDTIYGFFTEAVARNRNMSAANVIGTQAAVYMGEDAIKAGLADRLGTEDDAIALVSRAIGGGQKSIFASSVASATNSTKEKHMAETTPAAADANLDALIAQAKQDGYSDAAEIADLCTLAGTPQLASEFLKQKKTAAEVRTDLMARKAASQAGTELHTEVMPGIDTKAGGADQMGKPAPWSEIMARVTGRKGSK